MKCPWCNADAPVGAVFCQQCGKRVDDDGPAAEPAKATKTVAERIKGAATSPESGDEQEQPLWEGTYSGKAMIGSWLGAAAVTVLLFFAMLFFPALRGSGVAWSITLIVISILWCGLGAVLLYRKLSISYELTNQRFIHNSGFLTRTTDRIEVIDMDDVTFSQGLIQRFVDVGTIKIISSDRTHPELSMYGISEVKTVADLIDDTRRRERRRRGLHIEAI